MEEVLIVAPGAKVTSDLSLATEVEDESQNWKVVGVEKLRPATATILYFMGVAR